MDSCLSFPFTLYSQDIDDSLFLDQPNTSNFSTGPAAYSSPAFQTGLSLLTSPDRDYVVSGSTPCTSPDKQRNEGRRSVDPASSLLPPLSNPSSAEHTMLASVDPNAIVLPSITQWYHSSLQNESRASHNPPPNLVQSDSTSVDLPAIPVQPDQISVGGGSDLSADHYASQRSRRKRLTGEVSSVQLARRDSALAEEKRRTKTCCIYYQELDPVPQAVRKLTEANWQYTSIILRMTSFPDIGCQGVWVVYVVKESIPVSRWTLFNEITGGMYLRLNPAAEAKSRKVTSFDGVIVNFPYTSLDILCKNELAIHRLPQPNPKMLGGLGKRSRVDDGGDPATVACAASKDSGEDSGAGGIKRVNTYVQPEALVLCETFLRSGRPLSGNDSSHIVNHIKAFLGTLPREHGKYATLLLEGLQLEFLSQAMLLQSQIVMILVEDFGFPHTFSRLSQLELESPQTCFANLPSDDARHQFSLLMDTQETVFAFNISLYDSTSLMFLIAVQLLTRFGSSTHISLADQPVSIETARILAYDILGVSEYIKKLIHFAKTLGVSPKITPCLLRVPHMSEVLLELTSDNTPPSSACVNSHKIRLNALVSKLTGGSEYKSKVQQLQKIFHRVQECAPHLKYATSDTQGFSMLCASSFSPNPGAHKELILGFIGFIEAIKEEHSQG